jgi:hypothetical protein
MVVGLRDAEMGHSSTFDAIVSETLEMECGCDFAAVSGEVGRAQLARVSSSSWPLATIAKLLVSPVTLV